jgi:hypothetical protein
MSTLIIIPPVARQRGLGMIQPRHAAAAVPDAILMVFFIAAFVKTPAAMNTSGS